MPHSRRRGGWAVGWPLLRQAPRRTTVASEPDCVHAGADRGCFRWPAGSLREGSSCLTRIFAEGRAAAMNGQTLFRETIFALSSGALPSGVAVIRYSGPAVKSILEKISGVPAPRKAHLRELRAQDGRLLDHALVLIFSSPGSLTGVDVAELHVHGGRATVTAILE